VKTRPEKSASGRKIWRDFRGRFDRGAGPDFCRALPSEAGNRNSDLRLKVRISTFVIGMKISPGKFTLLLVMALLVAPPLPLALANEAAQVRHGRVLHTFGGVRHPSYDPTQNRRGCPLVIRSVPGSFSQEQCMQLMSELEKVHPKWRAFGRRNHAKSPSMKIARNGAAVWTVKLLGPPKGNPYLRGRENYIPFGELHILAVNHRSYGRAGTILLDTLGDSPDL